MQNAFAMLFLDKFSQWNILDSKNLKENHTEMNFTMVNRKVSKKGLCRFSFISSTNG